MCRRSLFGVSKMKNQKTTITVEKRGEGYIFSLFSQKETKHGVRCGLTPLDAATSVTKILAQEYQNGRRAFILAPKEVMEFIPLHLIDSDEEDGADEKEEMDYKSIMETMGKLARCVYGDEIPNNILNILLRFPLKAIGMMTQRGDLLKAPNQEKIAELMNQLPSDIKDPKSMSLENQGVFWLAYHKN